MTGDASRRLSIDVQRVGYGEIDMQMPAAPVTTVALHLTGRCMLEWTPDARPLAGRPTRGAMTIVPQGRSGRLRVGGNASEVLKIGIPQEALGAWAADRDRCWSGTLRDRFMTYDPLVNEVGLALLNEVDRPGMVDMLYRDALSNALLAHLVRCHATTILPDVPWGRRIYALTPSRARRCLELMEADLTCAIGLDRLARELGMSVSHFSAQFTQTFGRSPARYLTWLRLDRARIQLDTSRTPVATIARAVGFVSPSHFSQAFKAEFGEAPSRWRAMRG